MQSTLVLQCTCVYSFNTWFQRVYRPLHCKIGETMIRFCYILRLIIFLFSQEVFSKGKRQIYHWKCTPMHSSVHQSLIMLYVPLIFKSLYFIVCIQKLVWDILWLLWTQVCQSPTFLSFRYVERLTKKSSFW